MTAYTIFLIIVGIILLVLGMIIRIYVDINRNKFTDYWNKNPQAFWSKLYTKITFEDLHSKTLLKIFVAVAIITPHIYEFPRFPIALSKKSEEERSHEFYMYISTSDSQALYKQKLPRFGTFHSMRSWVITKQIPKEPITLTKVFSVCEEKQNKTVEIRFWIEGKSWSEFLLESYRSNAEIHPMGHEPEVVLFEKIQSILEHTDAPLEELGIKVSDQMNIWLKQNNINSVSVSAKPDEKRKVWSKE